VRKEKVKEKEKDRDPGSKIEYTGKYW